MADRFDDATQVRAHPAHFLSSSSDVLCSQKELQSFLDREQAQARVQQSIHTFTSMCWDKCVFRRSSSTSTLYMSFVQMHHWYALDAILSGRRELLGQLRRTIFGYEPLHGAEN
jgi:hypothetical protein